MITVHDVHVCGSVLGHAIYRMFYYMWEGVRAGQCVCALHLCLCVFPQAHSGGFPLWIDGL